MKSGGEILGPLILDLADHELGHVNIEDSLNNIPVINLSGKLLFLVVTQLTGTF